MAECKNSGKCEGKIVSSETLQQELRAEGSDIPDMGLGCACGFNRFSKRDKSWSSLPDFFIKLFKAKQ